MPPRALSSALLFTQFAAAAHDRLWHFSDLTRTLGKGPFFGEKPTFTELPGLAQRDKVRTLARQKQREMRGKADERGKSFPGNAEQPLIRKQVFANALKRVNKEIDRLRKFEVRTAHVEAARRAFALSRSEKFIEHPGAGRTARDGMQQQVIRRRRTIVPRSKIGSVTKATKVSQAIRDSKV